MADISFTTDEIRELIDAVTAREEFIASQLQPDAPWNSDWFRSPELQTALYKLVDALPID